MTDTALPGGIGVAGRSIILRKNHG
jgi:hypothetical protein